MELAHDAIWIGPDDLLGEPGCSARAATLVLLVPKLSNVKGISSTIVHIEKAVVCKIWVRNEIQQSTFIFCIDLVICWLHVHLLDQGFALLRKLKYFDRTALCAGKCTVAGNKCEACCRPSHIANPVHHKPICELPRF